MKRLWLVWVGVAMMALAGAATGAVAYGQDGSAVVPTAVKAGFRFQRVDDDWHHGGHWRGHRHWDGGDHWRAHTRIYLGFGNTWDPGWGPYWGPPPAYYYNPPVIVTQPPPPTVYISPEREHKPYYWYYCESAKRYYPYVKQCPGGWMKVVPHEPQQ
ncbi:MAG: hypothetical protein P8124_07685 [Gammaproteobacteria bacterium]